MNKPSLEDRRRRGRREARSAEVAKRRPTEGTRLRPRSVATPLMTLLFAIGVAAVVVPLSADAAKTGRSGSDTVTVANERPAESSVDESNVIESNVAESKPDKVDKCKRQCGRRGRKGRRTTTTSTLVVTLKPTTEPPNPEPRQPTSSDPSSTTTPEPTQPTSSETSEPPPPPTEPPTTEPPPPPTEPPTPPDPDPDPDAFAGLPFDEGELVAADYATSPQAIDIWNSVFNGFHSGNGPYDSSNDPQIIHRRSGGDPLAALDGQVHVGYRQMHTAGPQSLWDAANQPDHTRSQLGAWGRNSSIHVSEQGQREFIVYSVRLDPDTPIPGSVLRHTGIYWLSMVSQFKSILPSGNGGPMISVYEGYDGLQLTVQEGDSRHYVNVTDVPRGVWLRIGIDVLWSKNGDGAYRWWGDLDGDSTTDFEPLSERRSAATILPGFEAAAFNIGPYHMLNVPPNGRDYANIEILRHRLDDPWG